MISKISITTLVATCLMVGSNASPCRASSRATQIPTSLTTKITSTATATTTMISDTTDTTENTASSTTEVSSTENMYTTGLSGTALSSTEQLTIVVTESASGTETSSNPEKPTTTTTVEETSTVAESAITSVESTATSNDSTTTGAATTSDDSTTTEVPTATTEAASTTTTMEAPAGPTLIVNAGFEDSSESISPWRFSTPNAISVSIDTNVRYDGQNSARMDFLSGQGSSIRQPLQGLLADVSYTMSAWVRPDARCSLAFVRCAFSSSQVAKRGDRGLKTDDANTWQQVSGTCSYTQAQLDSGNLFLQVGFSCTPGAQCYIDSTRFTRSLV